MRRKKSEILEVVLETATGLYNAGLMDNITLREFDSLCIPPVEPLEPYQIKQIRESNRISQLVFVSLKCNFSRSRKKN